MKLVYTDDAMEELQRLREFIATHDPLAAAWAASELVSKIGLLPGFPELGSPVEMAPMPDSSLHPPLQPGCRQYLCRNLLNRTFCYIERGDAIA